MGYAGPTFVERGEYLEYQSRKFDRLVEGIEDPAKPIRVAGETRAFEDQMAKLPDPMAQARTTVETERFDRMVGEMPPLDMGPPPPVPSAAPSAEPSPGPAEGPSDDDPVSRTLAFLGISKPGPGAPAPDAIDRQSPNPPGLPLPVRMASGAMGFMPPPQIGNAVPPSEEEQQRVVSGDPFTPEDATSELGKFVMGQGQVNPLAGAETLSVAGIGQRSQKSLNRAFAQGLTEGSGPGDAAGAVRAAGIGDLMGHTAPAATANTSEVARIRIDKFPEPVREAILEAAEGGEFWRTQRRGVIGDEAAESMADKLARSADEIIAGGKAGKAYSTEETRAVRNALVRQAMKVNELAEQIAANPTRAPDEMIARQVAEGMKLADLSRVAEGARAEAGRALRAYQGFARDYDADPVIATQRIFKVLGDRSKAIEAVTEYQKLVQQGADAYQMATFWARAEKPPPGVGDWFKLLRYNSMLSGPRTYLVNLIGNGTEIPYRLVRDTVASAAKGEWREIPAEVKGGYLGFRRGVESAFDVLMHGITEEQALRGDVPAALSARIRNPVGSTIAKVLEAPGRGLQATDEVFKGISYGMIVGREAAIRASREGLTGQAWADRVADLMNAPSKEMMRMADLVSDRMTFKSDLGTASSVVAGLARIPYAGPVILPFVKTVANITARAVDRSPIGVLGTIHDVAKGKYGLSPGEVKRSLSAPAVDGQVLSPLGERVTDNAVGMTVATWLYFQALDGNVTGAGPDDPEKRDMLRATGWQPYSFKAGERYVSYANWGPFAMAPALAAGVAEAQVYAKPKADIGGMILDASRRTSQVVQEQSFLRGIGDVWRAMKEPDRYGARLAESLAESLVPFGAAINTVGQMTDPLLREPEKGNIPENIQERIPFARESLPARQDVLGRSIPNEQQGAGAIVPLRSSTAKVEPLLRELIRAGVDISPAPKTAYSIPFLPEDQRRFEQVNGDLISKTIPQVLSNAGYQKASTEQQGEALRSVMERLRDQARVVVIKEMGEPEARRRVREAATR